VLGEGACFDAATVDAIAAFVRSGHEVVLLSSNPSTVCSQSSRALRTYLEPLDQGALSAVLATEKPRWVYPFVGGVRASRLLLACEDFHGAEILGGSLDALRAPSFDAVTVADDSVRFEAVALVDSASSVRCVCIVQWLDGAPNSTAGVTPPQDKYTGHLDALEAAVRRAALARGAFTGLVTCSLVLTPSDGSVRVLECTLGYTQACAFAGRVAGVSLARAGVELAFGKRAEEVALASNGTRVHLRHLLSSPHAMAFNGLGEVMASGANVDDARKCATLAEPSVNDGVSARIAPTGPLASGASIVVLGPGPTFIGQGPELATCAAEALQAVRELGFVPVFIDASVEALALADSVTEQTLLGVLSADRIEALVNEHHAAGVLVQVGGEAALALAPELIHRGIRVLGPTPDAVSRAALAVDRSSATNAVSVREMHDAIVVDVDAVCDGARVVIAGVMEHLEPAFVHGGDAAALLPAYSLGPDVVARIEDRVRTIALDAGVVGLLAVRLAVVGGSLVVMDVEARAGRTTAFVSRATGFPLVNIATKVALGYSLDAQNVSERPLPRHVAARERVFSYDRGGADPALGLEMRSTGEVIGIDDSAARAYGKALRAIGIALRAPVKGAHAEARRVVMAVTHADVTRAIELARRFRSIGFEVSAIGELRAALVAARIPSHDGGNDSTEALRALSAGEVALAVVTAVGGDEIARTRALRAATPAAKVPCFTTLRLALLGCSALEEDPTPRVRTLQDWYAADGG
jgi:carbamoylphosphate synthase large subunit